MIDTEYLKQYYSQLTDDALDAISKDNLEPEALEILSLELTARKVEKLTLTSYTKINDSNVTHIPPKKAGLTSLLITILVSIGLIAGASSSFFARMSNVNSSSSQPANCDIVFDHDHAIATLEPTLALGTEPSEADIHQLINEFNQYTLCEEDAAKAHGSSANKYEILRMYINQARHLFSEGKEGDNSFNKFRTIIVNEARN